jgi:hypothetical protein
MPQLRIYLLLCLLLLGVFNSCYAQEEKAWTGFGIETNMMGGRILKHTPKFKAPIPPLSTVLDINFCLQTYGTQPWQQKRKFPIIGFGFTYTDYGNYDVYGYVIGAYPSLQMSLMSGTHIEWTMRAGFGIGYMTKHYERAPVWDTLDNPIGSNINNFSIFTTDLRYRINTHWDVQAGLNFTHVSNAALKLPNLGINMYGCHIGVRYFPVTSQPKKIMSRLPPLPNRWLIQSRLGIAFSQKGNYGGPEYRTYLASLYASKRWKGKNKMFAGVDYSYHDMIYSFLRNNEILTGQENQYNWKGAFFAGNEYLVGRVGILFQLGVYFHQSYLNTYPYYEKLGCNLYLVKKEQGIVKELYLSALLKAHKEVAELTELGVGVGF